ncbi:hypothetical protein CHLRE_06g246958v5 [Chlamydomonas reinhardtii]|uniref:Reverse transcriptase domain-containing protein n=1 Tax=Chlamydomonas reinhardtii TaxID=3055 RepID=A0A2K3DLT2_CHLRE|nr:uncharacterized protein CHLRE_06g246958v5 [Chlamydomonas reinhardtii]PNW81490.1 hypothetical protein CHLRE_06g246958v5 [Chlamydomonas reinhardtii]
MPHRFTGGVISVIYKKGDVTEPGNYCPITLLGSDYRILAKALATRLGPALARVIDPEQTAFLPKRLIGNGALFLRLLPHLLRQQGRPGLIAFLDFEKAYDTVDRTFLSEAMEAAGAGPNLRGWVHTLLADTRARAHVQGAHSQPVSMMAGVRQGCPLSPLLYLFVAHALLCWLWHKGVGLRLDPTALQRVAAVQYADDTKALLEGEQEVVAFLAAMHTFQHASGQRLNLSKVQLLRIGAAYNGTIPRCAHGPCSQPALTSDPWDASCRATCSASMRLWAISRL